MTEAEHFKAWLKSTGRTYSDVALSTNKSVSWIGEVARGHYPYYMAGKMPTGIWRWAISCGMPDLLPNSPTSR